MKAYKTLISVLGWEDRFIDGLKYDIEHYTIERILLLCYEECVSLTVKSKILVHELCKEKGIQIDCLLVTDNDPVAKWGILQNELKDKQKMGNSVLIEISTMPRDTIWTLLYFLNQLKISIDYIYHSPKQYSQDWLTKEPGKPRLLFKHSGITFLNKPTALVIISGFEIERTKQLVYFFEPKITVLGLQRGTQFNNLERNVEIHKAIRGFTETIDFELDGYDNENGFKEIKNQIDVLKNNYNIIVTSLGPKTTAISIYRAFMQEPEIALAYVPSKEFNVEYSKGIDKTIFGTF